jgi:hypothetical protein
VHNLDGPVVAIGDLATLIEQAQPETAGLISAADQPLPFPGSVDGSSFTELLGGSVMRSVQDGVSDAIRRFERLLADGLVQPPEPSPDAAAAH